ncbi:hypothetical protein [Pseudacidovorax intermedius]|uniref:hypothetical protein n=1 Tax=Pseudacidovorax intermedius TaxID=433924 RepID=UPI0012DC115D|nr:hypothetical protein [Pseudacidovorax intermedius]
MAGVANPGAFMNANKLARIESGLNTMASKVLDAVPIQQAWSKAQIASELHRTGCGASRDVVDGCLGTLKDRGAIKEPKPGHFQRVAARPITTAANEAMTPATIHPIEPAAAPSSDDTLSRLANLGALLRRAADECDALGLEVEERVKDAGKDGAKLRQLQAILKGLGD